MNLTASGFTDTRRALTALAAAAQRAARTAVAVGTPLPYGKWVEQGTKPHVIRARNARFLRFQIGPRTVFRRSVRHPGTKPQPYLHPAYWATRGAVAATVADGLRVAARTGQPGEGAQGMADAGLVVMEAARARVPVRRGDLRASIGTYVNGRRLPA